MHFPWSVVCLLLAFVLGYGFRPLVLRWKEHSERWQQRSEVSRRFLSLLPGYLVGFLIGVVLILIFGH